MWTIFIVQLVGLISPGPDFFYVSRKAMGDTRRNAILASIGISLGVGFWAILVLFGLAFLNKTIPSLQYVLMILGGGYLAYCGIKMVRVTTNAQFNDKKPQPKATSAFKEIINGLIINLSNPKIVVFFSSVLASYIQYLSQFIDIISVLLILVGSALCYFTLVSFLFSHQKMRIFYAKNSHYLDNLAGVVFILFGIKLIYEGISTLLAL